MSVFTNYYISSLQAISMYRIFYCNMIKYYYARALYMLIMEHLRLNGSHV